VTRPIIEVRGLSKQFGATPVLSTLDWQVAPGQVVGLLGRNGGGKSTLLECLLDLKAADSGSVHLFGEPATDLSEAARARIGYVPQQSELFEWLSGYQMLAYFKTLYPRWNDDKVKQLLARWGLDDATCRKAIGTLSGGQKQRLSIVRALAHDPDLLILDEPVAALDPAGRREFLRELVEGVLERNTTVVFSTHILSDLERVALDVAFLRDGKIALQGELDSLLEGARRLVGPGTLLDALTVSGELRRRSQGDGVTQVITSAVTPVLADFVRQHQALRLETLSLEELFVEVTQ
jgi:ABC-2 type transport system ATP-binding protein